MRTASSAQSTILGCAYGMMEPMTGSVAPPAAAQAPAVPRPRSPMSWWRSEPTVAIAVWVTASLLALALVHVADLNPLTSRGAMLPLGVGAVIGAVLLAFALRTRSELLPAIIVGCYAAWVLLVLLESYHGTPFGDSGLRGDTGRLTAAVTRYTTTWKPSDPFVPGIPIEYPPLFPYLLGHLANLLGRPGWTLVGDGLAATMSLSVMAGFLLWRRLVPSYVAVVLAAVPTFAFTQPRKAYEIVVLAVFVPWALATFARFREPGGLHWLPSGVLLGLMVQTYLGFPLFDAFGLAVLALIGWRGAAARRDYLRHLALTVGVALLVSAWYVGPYLYFLVFRGSERVDDYAVLTDQITNPLGVLPFTTDVLGLVELIGLFGLVVLRRKQWWAEPMLVMVAGAYAYRYVYLFGFTVNGHSGFLYYTTNLVDTLLFGAAVLTAWTSVPALRLRLGTIRAHEVSAVAATLFLAVMMFTGWRVWTPAPLGVGDSTPHAVGSPNLALLAHAEPLPDGQLPHYGYTIPATGKPVIWLPVPPIVSAVRARLGPEAQPVTLSFDERFFAYQPWPGYMSTERLSSNSLMKWDSRFAEIRRLAAITDPAQFTEASRHTRFGAIDVFVLRNAGTRFTFLDVSFVPGQFTSGWDVVTVPNKVVVAIRLPTVP